MLVSGYNNIIVLPNCTMLYYMFSGSLSLHAYVPEIKCNNNCNCIITETRRRLSYLDLGPPVPLGASGNEEPPSRIE